jgi:hypothetical protein
MSVFVAGSGYSSLLNSFSLPNGADVLVKTGGAGWHRSVTYIFLQVARVSFLQERWFSCDVAIAVALTSEE